MIALCVFADEWKSDSDFALYLSQLSSLSMEKLRELYQRCSIREESIKHVDIKSRTKNLKSIKTHSSIVLILGVALSA